MAHIWINGLLDTLPSSFSDKVSPKNFLKKIRLVVKDLSADVLRLLKTDNIPNDRIWFLALTKNNYDALKDVQQLVPDSVFVSFLRFRSSITKDTRYYPLSRRVLWDFIFPFYLVGYFFHNPTKALRYFDLWFTVHGTYEESIRLLKKRKPKSIVFTNDHLVIARGLLLAANQLDITTYYIPHASVSKYFPALEFKYALLDGEDTLIKYKQCGPILSEVHLIGMPKFDNYANVVNRSTSVKTLGIAFNMVDEVKDVVLLAEELIQAVPDLHIIIRPHPGDSRGFGKVPNGIEISDSKTEESFQFLSRIDALVAGESSIHLEAVLMEVYPLYYTFTPNNRHDFYGYIQNGLAEYYEDVISLRIKILELVMDKPSVQKRARFYNAAIKEGNYGKTSKIMSDFIAKTSLSQ